MRIRLEKFGGMIPRLHKRMLPNTSSAYAVDVHLDSGKIDTLYDDLFICDTQLGPSTVAIYKYGDHWLTFNQITDVVRGAIADDKSERFYFVKNGEGQLPRVSDNTLAVSGNEPTWEASRYYNSGDVVVPSAPNGNRYVANNAGTSGASEPASWNDQEVDNEITWTEEAIPDNTPADQQGGTPVCWNLPDKSYRLGVPAPTSAPTATRVGISGDIKGVEDYENYAGNNYQFTLTVDGEQDIDVQVSVTASILVAQNHLSGPGQHTLTFRLYRESSILDEKTVNCEASVEPGEEELLQEIGFQPPITKVLNATETGLLAGSYTYRVTVERSGITPSPNQNSVHYDYSWTGTTGQGKLGLTLDVGTGHPFTAGDRISITGVVGYEELNSIFDVEDAGDNTVAILIDEPDPTKYVSGGTWEQLPPIEDTYDRAYVYTYIAIMSGKFQEGPPSLPSELIEVAEQDDEVTITNIETPPTGYNISRIRLYRTVRGDESTEYKYVGEFHYGASVTDTLDEDDSGVGETLPSEDWYPPPDDLRNIIEMPGGIIAGNSGKEICFCEPYQPHAWPTAYRQTVRDDPVAIGAAGNSLFVLTKGYPYVITGTHPESMSVDRLELAPSCASKEGVVDMGTSTIYPSWEGLIMISPTSADLITKKLFTKRQWRKLNPETIRAVRFNDRYMFFYEGVNESGGFIFDPEEPDFFLVKVNYLPDALFADEATGRVFASLNGDIFEFDADEGGRRAGTWRSKDFHLEKPVSMSAYQVKSTMFPVTLTIRAVDQNDRERKIVLIANDSKPARMPTKFLSDLWSIEVEASEGIEAVYVAESMSELRKA